ncbi:MAG: hypothetical protein ACYC27_19095, partial [Armatimonadota bacterium]
MNKVVVIALCLSCFYATAVFAAFGGKAQLTSNDGLHKELAPYDLVELNYLGVNYCENLLDMRNNNIVYTHIGFDANASDVWHLNFSDDTTRFVEGLAWEADYSPVARIELARRATKGLIAAHVPGTNGYFYFRQRTGGKSFLIFDNSQLSNEGHP